MVRQQRWDEGHLLLELLTESKDKSVDEGAVFNMIAELPEFVADCFDALTENGDRRTASAASS
jgi:hypothetical protein